MSHFVCITLVPKTTTNIEFRLKRLLAPFDENKQVKRYQSSCNCDEWQAATKAREEATAKFGSFDDLRKSFAIKYKDESDSDDPALFQSAWQEHIKDWVTFEDMRKVFWLPQMKPQPECSCKGKGWTWSRYNPKSKWDWYSIGGRYTGFLDPDYDPSKDPANTGICNICKGSGVRNDMPVFAEGADPFKSSPIRLETAKCNGCDGKGKSIKWPTEWKKHSGDVQSAARWLELLRIKKELYTPYAVLTPKGEWFQRGEMGWFGMSSDDKNVESWAEQVIKIAEQHASTCYAVVTDCHI